MVTRYDKPCSLQSSYSIVDFATTSNITQPS